MTTNNWETSPGARRTSGGRGLPAPQSTASDIAAREDRLRRLILVAAFASFLSLFGLTIALDHQAAENTAQTTQPAIERTNDNRVVWQPEIRTRTS
jgi:hypothetical protein